MIGEERIIAVRAAAKHAQSDAKALAIDRDIEAVLDDDGEPVLEDICWRD